MNKCNTYLSLGSNSGDKKEFIVRAVQLIDSEIGCVVKQSSLWESVSWGYCDNEWYLNCVILCQTHFLPAELLSKTQEIEKRLGRTHKTSISQNGKSSYSARTIDVDILFYDNLVLKSPILTIPHPHIEKRAFVLKPFCEIAPGFIHPILGENIRTLLQLCEDKGFCEILKT